MHGVNDKTQVCLLSDNKISSKADSWHTLQEIIKVT